MTTRKTTEIVFHGFVEVKFNVMVVTGLKVLEFRFSPSSLHLTSATSCDVGLQSNVGGMQVTQRFSSKFEKEYKLIFK